MNRAFVSTLSAECSDVALLAADYHAAARARNLVSGETENEQRKKNIYSECRGCRIHAPGKVGHIRGLHKKRRAVVLRGLFRIGHSATGTHPIEVFSAGCSTCQETIELVKRLAGSPHEVLVHDMQKSEVASKAKQYGVRSVPAVVIDGKLAGCCAGRGRTNRSCAQRSPAECHKAFGPRAERSRISQRIENHDVGFPWSIQPPTLGLKTECSENLLLLPSDFFSPAQPVGSASSSGLLLFNDASGDQLFDIAKSRSRRSLRYLHPLVSG
jgi:glutaredoxin 3